MNEVFTLINKTYRCENNLNINPTAYFYDLGRIKHNIDCIKKNAPDNLKLFYAMKANKFSSVMAVATKYVDGVEIASNGELDIALKYVKNNNIIFTGPGKTKFELTNAIEKKIKYINVESLTELVRINNIAREKNIGEVEVLLRINLNYCINDSDEKMSGISSKMGIDENEIIDSIEYAKTLERISIRGIHVFAASGVMDYDKLIKSNLYIFDLVKKIENYCEVNVIDLGGGFGIDYSDNNRKFDVENYFKELKKYIKKYNFEDKTLILELGTYIVGDAGYYTSEIIDIKEIKGKKQIILAGGVNHSGLQLEMKRQHPVHIIPMNKEKEYEHSKCVNEEIADISGPLCMVSDKLSWDKYISHAEIGDIVVMLNSGAYCFDEGMHDFLSHQLPKIYLIKE